MASLAFEERWLLTDGNAGTDGPVLPYGESFVDTGATDALWEVLQTDEGRLYATDLLNRPEIPDSVSVATLGRGGDASSAADSQASVDGFPEEAVVAASSAPNAASYAQPEAGLPTNFSMNVNGTSISGSGQLWYASEGNFPGDSPAPTDGTHGDTRIGYIDSDGSNATVAAYEVNNTSLQSFYDVGFDTADNLYFGITTKNVQISGGVDVDEYYLVSGSITAGANQAQGLNQLLIGVESRPTYDVVNGFAVDYVNHVLYIGNWGSSATDDAILKVTYNPANGAFTDAPYSYKTGNQTESFNSADELLTNVSTSGAGDAATATSYVDGSSLSLNAAAHQLYYIDYDEGEIDVSEGYANAYTNGIYVVSTTASNPQPTLLYSTDTNVAASGNAYHIQVISGMAVDAAKGLIYFTTDDVTDAADGSGETINYGGSYAGLYSIPIAGGPATRLTLPGGISLADPSAGDPEDIYGTSGLTLDPNGQVLYVTDVQNGSSQARVVQLVLNGAGTGFTSGNNDFYNIDPNSSVPASALGLDFAALPVLGASGSARALQGGSAATADSTATLADADSDIQSATVQITGGIQSGDVLSASTAGTAISVSYGNGTLSLSGVDTAAHYQQVLDSLTYQDGGSDSSTGAHPTRILTWTVYGGEGGDPVSTAYNQKTTTVTIDRAPVATSHTIDLVENETSSAASSIDSDPDGDALTVTSVSGGAVGSAVAGTYGTLTLNSNDTYSYAASNTAAINSAVTGSHPVDAFTYQVSDGLGGVSNETLMFTIDRAPVAANHTVDLGEGGASSASSAIDGDPDGDTLTVTSLGGGAVGSAVAGTYGTLTLNANDTYSYAASNTAAIDAAATGSHPLDSFTYQVSDGYGGISNETLDFVIDRAPVVSAGAAASYTEGAAGAAVDSALTLSDPDGDTLVSASVSITGGFTGGDALFVVDANGISGSYNSGTGTLSLSGTASAADYQALLDAVAFSTSAETVAAHTAANGADTSRTITYVAGDGTLDSAAQTSTVAISVVIADTAADISSDFDALNRRQLSQRHPDHRQPAPDAHRNPVHRRHHRAQPDHRRPRCHRVGGDGRSLHRLDRRLRRQSPRHQRDLHRLCQPVLQLRHDHLRPLRPGDRRRLLRRWRRSGADPGPDQQFRRLLRTGVLGLQRPSLYRDDRRLRQQRAADPRDIQRLFDQTLHRDNQGL